MITLLTIISSTAFAGGVHAGLPVAGHQDLGPADFLDPSVGWTAPVLVDGVPAGLVRAYVGPTEASAAAWCEDQARAVQLALPPMNGLGDHAWGMADRLVLVQDGNVGIMVQLNEPGDAWDRATALVSTIADEPAGWPAAPTMRVQDELTFFEAPDAAQLQVVGGRRPLGEAWGYVELPSQVVAWDAWGRASVLNP